MPRPSAGCRFGQAAQLADQARVLLVEAAGVHPPVASAGCTSRNRPTAPVPARSAMTSQAAICAPIQASAAAAHAAQGGGIASRSTLPRAANSGGSWERPMRAAASALADAFACCAVLQEPTDLANPALAGLRDGGHDRP
jgi:hypothetical protein